MKGSDAQILARATYRNASTFQALACLGNQADETEDLEDWKPYSAFKRWKAFRGVHHWHPWKLNENSTDPEEEARIHRIRSEMWYERYCFYWFDLRRLAAWILATAMFALHVMLLVECVQASRPLLEKPRAMSVGSVDNQRNGNRPLYGVSAKLRRCSGSL